MPQFANSFVIHHFGTTRKLEKFRFDEKGQIPALGDAVQPSTISHPHKSNTASRFPSRQRHGSCLWFCLAYTLYRESHEGRRKGDHANLPHTLPYLILPSLVYESESDALFADA